MGAAFDEEVELEEEFDFFEEDGELEEDFDSISIVIATFEMESDEATFQWSQMGILEEMEELWGYRFGDMSLDFRRMSHELRAARGWPSKAWRGPIFYSHELMKKAHATQHRGPRRKN